MALATRRLKDADEPYHIRVDTEPSLQLLRDQCVDFDPTACVHCAGSASVPDSLRDPAKDFDSNAVITNHVLNTLRQTAPRCRFVLLSSAAVYGQPARLPITEVVPPAPVSPYGFHKWQAEISVREHADVYGMRTAACRIFSAYGAGLRRQVLWDLCCKATMNTTLRLMGTGEESRDFIHCNDVAGAVLRIIDEAPMDGETYNVASGVETSIRELAERVLRTLSIERPIEFDGYLPDGTPARWQADISRIRSLGFAPQITLSDGVAEYLDWFRGQM